MSNIWNFFFDDTNRSEHIMTSDNYPSGCFTLIRSMAAESVSTQNAWKLPLPSTMPYTDEFEWSSEDTATHVGNTIKDWAKGVENLKSSGSRIGRKVGGAAGIFSQAIGGIQNMFGSNNIAASLAGYTMGIGYNPNKILFFSGAPHRSFSMSFDLIAENEIQATNMANGVKKMRIDAAPSYNDCRLFFNYPCFFYIAVYFDSAIVMERPCCAIKTINSNISAAGGVPAFHKGGKPVSYILEIQGYDAIIETKESEQERSWLGQSGSGLSQKFSSGQGFNTALSF